MPYRTATQVLRPAFLVTLACFVSAYGRAQASAAESLHVVAVVPTRDSPDSYNPKIYRLDTQGPTLAYELDLEGGGLEFTRADFRSRRVVFAWPRTVPRKLCILNMDSIASTTVLPLEFQDILPAAWTPLTQEYLQYDAEMRKPSTRVLVVQPTLLDMPGTGTHWLALSLASFRGTVSVGYRLDSTPQREILDPAVIANLRIQGDFGLVDQLGESDARMSDIRHGTVFAFGVDIDVPGPEAATDAASPWRLVAHDGQTTVMYRSGALPGGSLRNGVSRLYIRKNGVWKSFQVPGSEPRVKMIDSWVIGAAVSKATRRSAGMAGRREVLVESEREKAGHNDSPGADERRKYQERYRDEAKRNRRLEGRPPTDSMFAAHEAYLPGTLFLIDTNSGVYREIRTGQGDSEILLVHNGTVYYRVNNSIFAALLQTDSIGASHLLVREDWVPDVHWAYWGH